MKTGGIDASRIESMLAQLKAAAQKPAVQSNAAANAIGGNGLKAIGNQQNASKVSFTDALKASLDQVNQSQLEAEKLGKNFAMGDDSVSLRRHDFWAKSQHFISSRDTSTQQTGECLPRHHEHASLIALHLNVKHKHSVFSARFLLGQ